jgi:hypothetical protein
MAKKVVIEPEDYEKLVKYIASQSVPFQSVTVAAEVSSILKKSILMEIELKEEPKPEE